VKHWAKQCHRNHTHGNDNISACFGRIKSTILYCKTAKVFLSYKRLGDFHYDYDETSKNIFYN